MVNVLAVFAHPDDESCLAGGILARYAREGADITLVTATRGEAGECQWCEGAALAEMRTRELECAARVLGIARVIWLDCHDSKLADCDTAEMATEIRALIRAHAPKIILTLPRTHLDDHPDHRAVGLWTTRAFLENAPASRELCYALNAERGRVHPRAVRIQVGDCAAIKMRAMECHRSQANCWRGLLADLQNGRAMEYWLPFCASAGDAASEGKVLCAGRAP